jgi:competence protein ComEC
VWLVLPLHAIVVALAIGCGLRAGVDAPPALAILACVVAFLPLALPRRRVVASTALSALTAVGVGLTLGALDMSASETAPRLAQGEHVLTATVLDGHRPAIGVGELVVSVDGSREGRHATLRMVVRDVDARAGLTAGDRIALRVRTVRRGDALHLWAFDAAAFDHARGTDSVATCVVQPVLLSHKWSWRTPIDRARQWAERAMIAGLAQPSQGVVIALVTGTRQLLDPDVRDRFAATGASHVIAVSGMHLALLAALMFFALERGFRRWHLVVASVGARRAAVVLTLPAAWAYVVFTGSPASAVRAGVMATFVLGAMWLERRGAGLHALVASVWLIALWRPAWVFDLGFGLSVTATWALIAWSNVRRPARDPVDKDGERIVVQWPMLRAFVTLCRDSLVTSTWASLATTPILLSAFGATPLWSAFTNLIVVPSLAFVTPPAAALALLLEALGVPFVEWIWTITDWSTLWSLWLCDLTVDLFDDALNWGRPGGFGLLGWGALAAVGPFALRLDLRPRVAFWLACTALIALDTPAAWRGNGTLAVHSIPVGQGDCSLVVLPDGTTLLVDAGGNARGTPTGRMFAVPWIRAVGRGRVDIVVATHADLDHIGGLTDAMPMLRPREVWLSRDAHAPAVEAFVEAAHAAGANVRTFVSDAATTIGGASVEVDVADGLALRNDDNAASLVIRVCHGSVCALLTGDIGVTRERELLGQHDVSATFLKVAHHGSETSTSEAFIDAVRPAAAAIHAGVDNQWNLPDHIVVERLERRGVSTVFTTHAAPPAFVTDGELWWWSYPRLLAREPH